MEDKVASGEECENQSSPGDPKGEWTFEEPKDPYQVLGLDNNQLLTGNPEHFYLPLETQTS